MTYLIVEVIKPIPLLPITEIVASIIIVQEDGVLVKANNQLPILKPSCIVGRRATIMVDKLWLKGFLDLAFFLDWPSLSAAGLFKASIAFRELAFCLSLRCLRAAQMCSPQPMSIGCHQEQ